MEVIGKAVLREYKDEVVFEGVRIHLDFEGLSVAEFAEKLLLIINWKSNHSDYKIIDVKTFYGTNTIEVLTYNEEATMHFVKQLVDDYKQIEVYEKVTVIDLTDMDVGCQLEEMNMIEEFGEFVITGK